MARRNRNMRNMGMHGGMHMHNCGAWCWHHKGGAGGIYCLGFLGALVYYLQTSTGFWPSVLAILKAAVWPALLVYHLLGL